MLFIFKNYATLYRKLTACFTTIGGAALTASGIALKALTEGAKLVKNSIRDIINERSEEVADEPVEAEVIPAEESVVEAEVAPVEEVPTQPETEEVETVAVEAE